MAIQDPNSKQLREHLLYLLNGGGAHASTAHMRVGAPAASPKIGKSTWRRMTELGLSWARWSRPSAAFTTCAHVTICRSSTRNPTPAAAANPLRKIRTVKPSRLKGM